VERRIRRNKNSLSRISAAVAAVVFALLCASSALAEILDDVQVRPEGADAVIRINTAVRLQFINYSPITPSDLFEIFFVIIADQGQQTNIEEARRIPGAGDFPTVTITLPLEPVGAQRRRFRVRFSRPVSFRARPGPNNRSVEIVIAGVGKDVSRVRPGAAVAATPEPRYSITLETFPTADLRRRAVIPSEFQGYDVFTTEAVRDGKQGFDLNLGLFATREAAEQTRQALLQRFPNARVIELAERRETAQPVVPPPPPTAVAPGAVEAEVDKQAAALIAKGRAALAAGDNEGATNIFNQLLTLPPNRYSQEAQELVGLARERAGELAKAKSEYELYLRLYPDSEGAQRVRERLAALERTLAAAPPGAAGPVAAAAGAPLRTFNGSISQYYYGGSSRIQTAFNTPVNPSTATLATIDVSQLVSNVDLNGRYRTTEGDVRLVFRDTYTWSFLDTVASFNRLNAAFVEYRGFQNYPLVGRLGRQVGLAGGVPARFDGVVAGVGFHPQWRANVVAGSPVEYPAIESTRYFYGFNVDFENLANRWTGNVYYIYQQVDGILDRSAVGTEVRYFNAGQSIYALVDYDTSYKEFNVTMLQGTFQTEGRTIINVLFDRRKAPTLTTTNAVFGQGTTSISTLLRTMTEGQLRQQALNVTAEVTQALLGFTTPVNPSWQVGLDARLSNVGALPATVVQGIPVPAQPATGNIWAYTAQAIGSNLYSARDINVFNASYLTSPTFTGQLYSYNNVSAVQNWTIEPYLRYYTQKDNQDVNLNRLTPGLRITYRVRPNIALESEYAYEKSTVSGPTQRDDTNRQFWYVGYRIDL